MTFEASSPLWVPSADRVASAAMTRFAREVERRHGVDIPDYWGLWRWSVERPGEFWDQLWVHAGVIGERGTGPALVDGERMPGARFFPEARLNYAENLLRRHDDGTAIVFRGEDKVERTLSWKDLHDQVSRIKAELEDAGVGPGDRVAAFMPNMPETVVAMLATSAIGAIFSSASPDFGVQGVLDRFGQIEPKVLIAVDGYWYAGKRIDCGAKVREVSQRLPTLARTILVPYLDETPPIDGIRSGILWPDALARRPGGPIDFNRMPFDHPLYILYSSGTTGVPKCIVHGQGGSLLQHLKEQLLHSDIRPGDRVFYFTTCGWMMWNWLVSGLACGATLLLYDGSPFHPSGETLFDYADDWRMSFFGTSAKYIDALKKSGIVPARSHKLAELRTMASTGSPLVPESFDWVYEAVKGDLHLASISGGTDIMGCFALGVPTLPVWRGELQAPGLGMAVDVFDDEGRPVKQEKGELVCTKPFASMPVAFWNDPDGTRYRAAYFERFPGIWCHGDFVEITAHGGLVIYGRSDATLNPGGVRIGTAEIYRAVEQLPEVVESVAIGQDWEGDVRVVLFVVLRSGLALDEGLEKRIRQVIRERCTPRHVPARIVQVDDIPRTKSGKITELAIRDLVHGRVVKNIEALANPQALDQYRDRPELKI